MPDLLAIWPQALQQPHRAQPDSVLWHLDRGGVVVEQVSPYPGLPATAQYTATMQRVWKLYRLPIQKAAAEFGVPPLLLVATAVVESSGDPKAERREPGFTSYAATPHKVSIGLCQTLISTARQALKQKNIGAADLLRPDTSFRAAAAYIRSQSGRTQYDPPLVAAAYNAGSVRRNDGPANRFKLACYPLGTDHHVCKFIAAYNAGWGIPGLADEFHPPLAPK